MSLDKAIKNGKEHRKSYRGCKAIDKTCRNGGSCPYCQKNRQYKNLKRVKEASEKMEEATEENYYKFKKKDDKNY